MATLSFEAKYICWVQRALIRNAWPGQKIDGVASAAYRDAIRRFQTENGLNSSGDVDSPTQDRLIKLNHVDADYTAWVQHALVKAGVLAAAARGSEPIMDRSDSATRQAIRHFQGKPGIGLAVDGWVGVKTELALMKFSTTAPPDDTGKPAPCKPRGPEPPPPSPTKVEAMTVWLNVFIPRDLPKDIVVRPFAGPHAGKVFLRSPAGFFATDQRGWSKRPDSSSRMHSRVDILLRHGTVSSIGRKRIGQSIRVDRFGRVECLKRASTDNIRISKVHESRPGLLTFSLSGEGTNPCSPGIVTPDIDYALNVRIALSSDRTRGSIRVTGGVDEFPSFEMYAVVNDDFDNVVQVFRRRASSSPFDLVGGAVRRIDASRDLVVPSTGGNRRELPLEQSL